MKTVHYLSCWLLFAVVFQNARLMDSTKENVDCFASSSINTTCTVNYTSSVTLHCVGNSSGSWWRVTPGGKKGICTEGTCQIAGNPWLHNEDSGKYFCRVPVNSSFIDYYVTLTVLAPPSIICKYCQYNEETKSCMLPMIKKEETEDVHLTVEFSGVGPFSVVWHHSGDVLECSNNTADKTQCSVKRFSNSTYGYETLLLPAPHLSKRNDSGVFQANVSNEYGYNETSQIVEITCDPIFPPQGSDDRTVNMKVGETKDISLNATGSQQDYLWLCYTTDEHTTTKNISLNTSCVQCLGEHSGPCDPLPNRPNWTVTRSQQGSCFERTKLTLTVRAANISEEDRGKFMLTWSSDEEKQGPNKHKVLTVVTLNITADSRPRGSVKNKTNYMYIYISIGGSSVALLVIVTGIVMVAWSVWRRSNTPASADTPINTPVASEDTPRSRRRRRRAYFPSPPVCAPRLLESDSEGEYLNIQGPNYGSINVRNPPTSDNDTVTLGDETDVSIRDI